MAERFASVDEYIDSFPDDVQVVLHTIRRTLHGVVPDGGETMSYQIPTITLDGRYLVYFAGWKHHVSVYPVPSGDAEFEQEVAAYRTGKGTLKFPLSQPMPYDLIARVARLLLQQRSGD